MSDEKSAPSGRWGRRVVVGCSVIIGLSVIVGQRTAWAVALSVAAVFAAIKVDPSAADTYRTLLGQIHGLASGLPLHPIRILHTVDSTDLIALPGVIVAPLLIANSESPIPTMTRTETAESRQVHRAGAP